MIKINSELPICMLSSNNELNEYDFVLFHLYKNNEQYRKYYLNQRKINSDRLMILDNSAYEFFVSGDKLVMNDFYDAIIELKPDYYILPDSLMNFEKTITDTKSFLNIFGKSLDLANSRPIAVLQGNSIGEFLEAASIYNSYNIDAIAIPFHNSFFRDIDIDVDIMNDFFNEFGPDNVDAEYAMGRVQFMRDYKDQLKSLFNHIHLLGSHQPYEKKWYHDFDTMDTGYPVKCAINGIELGKDYEKPDIIIDNFLNENLNNKIKDLIRYNITEFKKIQYIPSIFNTSINNISNIIKKEIKKFIEDNYQCYYGFTISDEHNKNGLYEVSCDGGVVVKNKIITSLTNNLFEWTEIKGYFSCAYCINLKTLEGAPKKVNGGFYCNRCDNLKSLEGAPKFVGKNFSCSGCNNLKSLEYIPSEIHGYIFVPKA